MGKTCTPEVQRTAGDHSPKKPEKRQRAVQKQVPRAERQRPKQKPEEAMQAGVQEPVSAVSETASAKTRRGV